MPHIPRTVPSICPTPKAPRNLPSIFVLPVLPSTSTTDTAVALAWLYATPVTYFAFTGGVVEIGVLATGGNALRPAIWALDTAILIWTKQAL